MKIIKKIFQTNSSDLNKSFPMQEKKQNIKTTLGNFGCGQNYHSSWINFDFNPHSPSVHKINLLNPLELSKNSFTLCYLSHVLEHLPRQRVSSLLVEFRDLLVKNGVIRVVVPDMEAICRQYLLELLNAANGDNGALYRHEWMTIELIDQMTRTFSGGLMGRLWWSRPLPAREFIISRLGEEAGKWLDQIDSEIQRGSKPLSKQDVYQSPRPKEKEILHFRQQGEIHQWMYDRVSLKRLLEEAGFQSVKVCEPTESSIPDFASYHLDTNEYGETRKPDSLFMEAIKLG